VTDVQTESLYQLGGGLSNIGATAVNLIVSVLMRDNEEIKKSTCEICRDVNCGRDRNCRSSWKWFTL